MCAKLNNSHRIWPISIVFLKLATWSFNQFTFGLRKEKRKQQICTSVLLTTSSGCHRIAIKNANSFVRRMLKIGVLHKSSLKALVDFLPQSCTVKDKRADCRSLTTSNVLEFQATTRKPLIFQENKHSVTKTSCWNEALETISGTYLPLDLKVGEKIVSYVFYRIKFHRHTQYPLTSVPNLKTNSFPIKLDGFYFKIYSNCVKVCLSVGEINITKKKTRFSHARIADHQNFE